MWEVEQKRNELVSSPSFTRSPVLFTSLSFAGDISQGERQENRILQGILPPILSFPIICFQDYCQSESFLSSEQQALYRTTTELRLLRPDLLLLRYIILYFKIEPVLFSYLRFLACVTFLQTGVRKKGFGRNATKKRVNVNEKIFGRKSFLME